MPARSLRPLRLAAWSLILLGGPQPMAAEPPWTQPQLLDTRLPLEFGQPRQDPSDGRIYLPTLFDLASNSLEFAVVDTAIDPPGYSTHPVASGAIFALGAAHQVGNRIGFSFIDPVFDGRFGTCLEPCTSPANQLVSAGTFIDSASAGTADDFFVALLDNAANHSILTRYSTNGGSTWQTLHTTLPAQPGGVYTNFQGGKRIALVVDPTSTDPTATRNCLIYEVRPAPGTTTALRVHCRVGAGAGPGAFNVAVDNDVPNGAGQFDKFIETNCLMIEGGGGDDVLCVYNHRQTQQTRVVRVGPTGTIVLGPTPIGATPPGTDLFGLTVTASGGNDEVRVLRLDSDGDGLADVTVHPTAGQYPSPGPPGDFLPVTSTPEDNLFNDPITAFLWGFFGGAFVIGSVDGGADAHGATTGLFFSRKQIPLFADGFDTGNRLRWSLSFP
jgi:hypothetical protein